MQKKVILSIITINVLIGSMFLLIMQKEAEAESFFNILNSNQVRVYNPPGFKLDEMENVKKMDGVEKATFTNREIFPSYYMYIDSGLKSLSIMGIMIESDNKYQQELDYLAGSYLTDKNQVIIDKSLADELITGGFASSYENLIGEYIGDKQEIVGVYPNSISYDLDTGYNWDSTKIVNGKYVAEKSMNFENSFMTFNTGEMYYKDQQISQYNDELVFFEYENSNKVVYKEDGYDYVVDYDKSVANGLEGLVDPDSDEYGDTFNQYLTINVDGDLEQVVSNLKSTFPRAAVVTASTKVSEINNNRSEQINVVLMAVGLELIILVPVCYYGRRRK